MKKIAKITMAVMMTFIMIISVAGCGFDMNKVKGDWTLATYDGMTVDEAAGLLGYKPEACAINITVTDNSMIMATYKETVTYKIRVTADGFDPLEPSDESKAMVHVTYDEANDTISYDGEGGTVKLVFKRGTVDLTPAIEDPYATANDDAVSDESYEEDSEEEYSDEEDYDDEYSDEEDYE